MLGRRVGGSTANGGNRPRGIVDDGLRLAHRLFLLLALTLYLSNLLLGPWGEVILEIAIELLPVLRGNLAVDRQRHGIPRNLSGHTIHAKRLLCLCDNRRNAGCQESVRLGGLLLLLLRLHLLLCLLPQLVFQFRQSPFRALACGKLLTPCNYHFLGSRQQLPCKFGGNLVVGLQLLMLLLPRRQVIPIIANFPAHLLPPNPISRHARKFGQGLVIDAVLASLGVFDNQFQLGFRVHLCFVRPVCIALCP